MNALTNFLSERRKPKYNPKILVEFPFNYLYKVKQMKHNHFNPKKLHRISECEKKKNNEWGGGSKCEQKIPSA